jgi:hypothetical protein
MKQQIQEVNNLDIVLTSKVLIRSEYPQILLKYFDKLSNEAKEDITNNKKISMEMSKLMKEEKITVEYKSFVININKSLKQIIIDFMIKIKIEKKFLLTNLLNSKATLTLDYNKKEIEYNISEIILYYYIGDEMVSYINLERIQFKEHFMLYVTHSQESKIKNLINTFFVCDEEVEEF